MQRLKVNAYQVALAYKRGALREVFTEGRYWLGWGTKVVFVDMTLPLDPNLELDLLLRNETLANMVDVIDVKDNQIALLYKGGIFHRVLSAGKYAYWKGVLDYSYQLYNMDEVEIPKTISRKVLQNAQLSNHLLVHVVESYEKGLLYVDGQFVKTLEAGVYYFWKSAKLPALLKADMRKLAMEVSGQELLTRDKANIRINFQAQYQLVDIIKALVEAKDVTKQLYTLMQLALREYVGQRTLDELLANKTEAGNYVLDYAKEKSGELGVTILNAGIKDIILPGDVKDIMNQVLIAEKRAQANVIMRREETASTRSLLNTAKLMEDKDMLYRLKEMEYVEKIAEKIGEITVSGGGQLLDQLKGVFTTGR